jgi:hypothetical protein
MLKNRRNVGRDEKLAVAETDDDRRAFTNGDDFVRIIG